MENPTVLSSLSFPAASSTSGEPDAVRSPHMPAKLKQKMFRVDMPLMTQLDTLTRSEKKRVDALGKLHGILDTLWNECLSMSNNEQHALSLVQQLGQDGVSLCR